MTTICRQAGDAWSRAGLDVLVAHAQVPERLRSEERGHSARALRKTRDGVVWRADGQMRRRGVVDDGERMEAASSPPRYSLAPMTTPRRKSSSRHRRGPDRTLERALALGAQDHGVLVHARHVLRRVPGRLKLREQEPAARS
jgi:hypothetical protein